MTRRWGSDLVVDLLTEAEVRFVAFNPGASVRGVHDSLVHAGAGAPQLILCLHEGVAVGIAQGYAKASGQPMAVLLHDVVGLQNASMAIYNAWCDRVPLLVLGGAGPMAKARRRPWIEWIHTASAQAEVVRDYVKWDDQPHDLASAPESFARAFTMALASPSGPVYWCLDVDVQEEQLPEPFPRPPLTAFAAPTPPAANPHDLDLLASELRAAESPVIVAGYAGDVPEAFHALVELAELLHVPVVDAGSRLNFPTDHELWGEALDGVLEAADLVVLLDVDDPLAVGGLPETSARVVAVSPGHLRMRSWSHDYKSLVPTARHLTSEAAGALQGLLDRLRHEPPPAAAVARRRARHTGRTADRRAVWRADALAQEADNHVPLERLLIELGDTLEPHDWMLAQGTVPRIEHRLWDFTRPRQWCGHTGGGGLGYGPAAAVGVALAAPAGTVVVDVQGDGDLLYAPQALWTAAQQRLPVLFVVHNNRAYGNTIGHARQIAADRGRPAGHEHIGSELTDPPVDLASLARGFGVPAWGPVGSVADLRVALAEALKAVTDGGPAFVDVVTASNRASPRED